MTDSVEVNAKSVKVNAHTGQNTPGLWALTLSFDPKSQKSKATLPKMVSVSAPGKVINIVINMVEGMIYVINRLSTYLST